MQIFPNDWTRESKIRFGVIATVAVIGLVALGQMVGDSSSATSRSDDRRAAAVTEALKPWAENGFYPSVKSISVDGRSVYARTSLTTRTADAQYVFNVCQSLSTIIYHQRTDLDLDRAFVSDASGKILMANDQGIGHCETR